MSDEPSGVGSEGILITQDGGVMIITLNRPEKLNAFNLRMHAAIRAAFAQAGDDQSVRAVLLTGRGKGFCAGQDLSDRDPTKSKHPPDLERSALENYNPLVRAIRALQKPVVCAVNGVAAGAGANLALACDIVLAAESARFVQSFAKVGLTLDAGGSWVLPRLIGLARARAIAITAQPVFAAEAASWGMIWRAVPDDMLMSEALQLARSLADSPTYGVGLTKRALDLSGGNTLEEQLELEAKFQGYAGRSTDYAEGVSAFLEKRKPSFTGIPPIVARE